MLLRMGDRGLGLGLGLDFCRSRSRTLPVSKTPVSVLVSTKLAGLGLGLGPSGLDYNTDITKPWYGQLALSYHVIIFVSVMLLLFHYKHMLQIM